MSLRQVVRVGTAGLYTFGEVTYGGTRACKLSLEVLSLALQVVCDPVGPSLSLAEVTSLQHSSHRSLKIVASKVRGTDAAAELLSAWPRIHTWAAVSDCAGILPVGGI